MKITEVLGVSIELRSDAVGRFDHDLVETGERARAAQMQAEHTAVIDGEISQEEQEWEADVFNRLAYLRGFERRGQVPVRYDFVILGIRGSLEIARPRTQGR